MLKSIALCLFCLQIPALAIVVQDYTAAEKPPSSAGLGLDWSYVYNYNSSSAVAVGGSWLLTAAHVADDGNGSISADGTVYYPQETVYHNEADLALVRFDKDFLGFYPLYTGGLVDDPRLQVLMVGYGTIGSVNNFWWTDNGSGRGTKRWGTQQIDSATTRVYDVGNVPTENNGFLMDFYLPSTAYEAGSGVGDSGGGVFYEHGGVWKLAGINTLRTPNGGGGYLSTFAVAMADYADWIAITIPESGTTSLMGLATFGLFLMRAGTRRKSGLGSVVPFWRVCTCDYFTRGPELQRSRFRMREVLVELGRRLRILIQPTKARMCSRYREYDRIFWNHMVAAHERKTARRQACKLAFKQKTLGWLDTFLKHIMK